MVGGMLCKSDKPSIIIINVSAELLAKTSIILDMSASIFEARKKIEYLAINPSMY